MATDILVGQRAARCFADAREQTWNTIHGRRDRTLIECAAVIAQEVNSNGRDGSKKSAGRRPRALPIKHTCGDLQRGGKFTTV